MSENIDTIDFKRGSFWMQLLDTARVPIPLTKRRASLTEHSFKFDVRNLRDRVIGGVRIHCGKNCDPHIAGQHFDTRLRYGRQLFVEPNTFVYVHFEGRSAGDPLVLMASA